MTRKDYVAIAQCVYACMPPDPAPGHERSDFHEGAAAHVTELARKLASTLAADNPRFDRSRFLKACGVQS